MRVDINTYSMILGVDAVKALAFFGVAGVVTSALTGGTTAIVIGNLALLAGTAALFITTVNLTPAPS